MWTVIEIIVLSAIILVSITEFFYPLMKDRPLFPSFRSGKGKADFADKNGTEALNDKEDVTTSLEDKINIAKDKVKEVKSVQKEVNEYYKSAEELKRDADDLLT